VVGRDQSSNKKKSKKLLKLNSNQSVFKIDALLQMPGLNIISQSTIGMKLLLSNGINNHNNKLEDDYPEFQFTLLDSQLKPNGPKPVVWLFNKLTKYRDSTSSFTRVRVEQVMDKDKHDDTNDHTNTNPKIRFVTDARLETRMHLPSSLLKVLPNVNIDKFEIQGSEAVQKLLEKELEPALNAFCDAFVLYLEENREMIELNQLQQQQQQQQQVLDV
jgi:hypothetical protein